MRFWRALLTGLVILLATRVAQGQQPGALIGFLVEKPKSEEAQTFEEIKEPVYQTVWVAPDASGKLAALVTIPNLIVPMKDGFWHVGVKQMCEFSHEPGDQTGGNESMRQAVWRAPISMAAKVQATQLCREHDPDDYAPPFGRSEQDQMKISQCGFELMEIEYVSPAVLSVRKYDGQSESCEPRGGRYSVDFSVVGYESDEALTVRQVLGDEARAAYLKALPKQGQGDGGEDCGEPANQDSGWRIDRHAGRWALYAHQGMGNFGCHVDAYVPFRLQSNVTGDNSPSPEWKQLKASVKDFRDAYVSPTKDLLIVMTGTELRFCQYVEGMPGKALLTLPAYPVVMLQWSTGKHVQDWTQQLGAIAAHALPEPEVQTAGSR
jgi:hypothetical protein